VSEETAVELTWHHLHASSRCIDRKLKDLDRNKRKFPDPQHVAFHFLFSNMVPVEMIRHLNRHWAAITGVEFTRIEVVAEFGATYRYSFKRNGRIRFQTDGKKYGHFKNRQRDWNLVFGETIDAFDAMVQIVQIWSPSGEYWKKVVLKAETIDEELSFTYIPKRRKRSKR
jgi:hypothetical protein